MLESFSQRELFALLFSGEFIFALFFTLSALIVMRAVITFLGRSGELYTHLQKIEAELTSLQATLPGKLQCVSELRQDLKPLEQEFKEVRAYYAHLLHLEHLALEEEMQRQREAEGEKRERKKRSDSSRRRRGLDALFY